MAFLRSLRSVLSLVLVLLGFATAGSLLYLVYLPALLIFPRRRVAIVSHYMHWMCAWMILPLMRLGGARFERQGQVRTDEPALLVMNHQSLLDIPTAVVMSAPYSPLFVTRARYAFVPYVSTCVRWLGCPLIDPKRDAQGAIETIANAARELKSALLIFPEGHRTTDGEVRPFRPAGLQAILSARRLPVYLLVTDGYWHCRRLIDFVLNVQLMQGRTELVGPFTSPEDPAEIPAFIEKLRDELVAHLRRMRGQADAAA